MRVAVITAGQPRFTREFIRVLNQLKGFDTADLYINLWESSWVDTVEQGRAKIIKILPSHITLKKLQIAQQPQRALPNNISNDKAKWWYDRRIGQIHCLKMACDLITEDYDVVIRVRLDGSLDSDLDISSLDLVSNQVLFCDRMVGANQTEPNDQFFVGTLDGIRFLCNLYLDFDKYMIECCPDWVNDEHSWSLEHIIRKYFESNGKKICRGSFNHDINRGGRSQFTDKHFHHSIVEDPTA